MTTTYSDTWLVCFVGLDATVTTTPCHTYKFSAVSIGEDDIFLDAEGEENDRHL